MLVPAAGELAVLGQALTRLAGTARALIGHPELVIADEPTSALDAERQAAFLELLIRECDEAGSTLLFVSRDWRLADRFDGVLALPDINRARERPS